MAGKKITVGRASVTIGPELEAALDRMISTTYVEIKREVESITSDVTDHARGEWYDNVTRRTGKTGGGIDYEMRLTPTKLRGVVFSNTKDTYYVHRPGPFSRLLKRLNDAEYRDLMAYWRRNGTLPPEYVAESMTDRLGRRRPVRVSKRIDNPQSYDGKNLWKILVLDYGKRLVKMRLLDIDRALQTAARRVAA